MYCSVEMYVSSPILNLAGSSIEVIVPNEVQQEPPLHPESTEVTETIAKVPVGLALQLPSTTTPTGHPWTNVATVYDDELFTEDENDDKTVLTSLNNPGRNETLSPTPNVVNKVRSAIQLTANDLQSSNQPILAKCGEVDFLLSTNATGPNHNAQLREELVMLILILYQTAFNTAGFPSLEKYLWETVGTLPHCYDSPWMWFLMNFQRCQQYKLRYITC